MLRIYRSKRKGNIQMRKKSILVLACFFALGLHLSLKSGEVNTLNGSDQVGVLKQWAKGENIDLYDNYGKKLKSLSKENFISWSNRPLRDPKKGQVFVGLTNGVGLTVVVDEWLDEGLKVKIPFVVKGKKTMSISYDDVHKVIFLDQVSGSDREILNKEIKQFKIEDDDILFLESDSLKGLLSTVSDTVLKFERGSKTKNFKLNKVRAFVLANEMEEVKEELLLKTTNGYEFPVSDFKEVEKRLIFQTALGEISLRRSQVSSINYRPKNRLYLADLKPIKVEENYPWAKEKKESYPFKYQVNRRTKYPLSTATKIWRHGIAAHSDSKLTWKVPEGAKTLSGAVALDYQSSGYKGSVHFRIYVDGEKKFDSGLVKGTTVTYFKVPLEGKKKLKLEVVTDPGNEKKYNEHDKANWLGLVVTLKK
jgi:hypothetical protein